MDSVRRENDRPRSQRSGESVVRQRQKFAGSNWSNVYSPFNETGRIAIDQKHVLAKRDFTDNDGDVYGSGRGSDRKNNDSWRSTASPFDRSRGGMSSGFTLPTKSLADAEKADEAASDMAGDSKDVSVVTSKELVKVPPPNVLVGSTRPNNGSEHQRSVTVFGFPRDKFSSVLRSFRQIGKIESFELGDGNWVNLRYETVQQAQLALSRDREMMDGVTMLGVVKCDKQFRLKQERRRSIGMSRHRTSSELSRPYALERLAREYTTDQSLLKLSVSAARPAPSMTHRDGLCTRLMRWFFNV